MILLLVSCSPSLESTGGEVPPVVAPVPESRPAPAPASERVYVRASSLNLREAPSSSGRLLGKLTVNSPLSVLERREGWVRVRGGNGREGWVSSEFVDPEALTAEFAVERAKNGPPEERLSWWQRATALDGSRPNLEGLAVAYEALGEASQAAAIRNQLDWPVALFPASDWIDGKVSIEWHVGYDLGEPRDIPRSQWSPFGLDPEAQWWALPTTGPAVRATPTEFMVVMLSECSGANGRVLRFTTPALAPGDRVIALHRGAPPQSWRQSLTRPKESKEDALARAKAVAERKSGGKAVTVELAPTERAWVGRASWQTGEESELGYPIEDVLQIEVSEAEVKAVPAVFRFHTVLGKRDVTGDGRSEIVFVDECGTTVVDDKGEVLSQTEETCCGC